MYYNITIIVHIYSLLILLLVIAFIRKFKIIQLLKIKYNIAPIFYDIAIFKKFNVLQNNYKIIANEVNNLLKNSISNNVRKKVYRYGSNEMNKYINSIKFTEKWLVSWNINNDKPNFNWLNFPLIYNDIILTKSAPFTTELLKKIKGIRIAGFSWMLPKSIIYEHTDDCGLITDSLALHLGLNVPNNCFLIVNNKKIEEKNGKCIIFDSNYKHSAYNYSDNNRLLLYIDFLKSY